MNRLGSETWRHNWSDDYKPRAESLVRFRQQALTLRPGGGNHLEPCGRPGCGLKKCVLRGFRRMKNVFHTPHKDKVAFLACLHVCYE